MCEYSSSGRHEVNPLLAVAVSGGADSLYSLIRLKKEGARLFALHALLLPERLRPHSYAPMLQNLRALCSELGVELVLTDLSREFEELIIAPFAASYLYGATPNPCAFCNRYIKFGLFWREAVKLGAGGLVTGHYARVIAADQNGTEGIPAIFAARDESKDQSYFLALTPLELLGRGIFPLASLRKDEVLACLAAQGITAPQEGESQEICFVPGDDYRTFLRDYASLPSVEDLKKQLKLQEEEERAAVKAMRLQRGSASMAGAPKAPAQIPLVRVQVPRASQTALPGVQPYAGLGMRLAASLAPGPALLPDGSRVGAHYGLWNYTQGQRHGLGIAWKEPLFVLGKDIAANILQVGPKAAFTRLACICRAINLLVPCAEWPDTVLVKVRYRQKAQAAAFRFWNENGELMLRLDFSADESGPRPAPGQVAAVYAQTERGMRLLAGAVITDEEAGAC